MDHMELPHRHGNNEELSRLEQKRSAAAMEEKTILDKLWERYELSHSEAQAQRVELESVPKATRRIAELTRDIKALGTPNIGAIEEFERVNTRYTYLSEQRTDVERAMGELTGVIDELTPAGTADQQPTPLRTAESNRRSQL